QERPVGRCTQAERNVQSKGEGHIHSSFAAPGKEWWEKRAMGSRDLILWNCMLGRALVLTISDTAAAGKRDDLSGPEARRILTEAGFEVASIEILPDERNAIESRLRRASEEDFRLVVTSVGTGLSP